MLNSYASNPREKLQTNQKSAKDIWLIGPMKAKLDNFPLVHLVMKFL